MTGLAFSTLHVERAAYFLNMLNTLPAGLARPVTMKVSFTVRAVCGTMLIIPEFGAL